MSALLISRLEKFDPVEVGSIDTARRSFCYSPRYLANPDALPLSASLPLRADSYFEQEFRPYFEGLLPEGSFRLALAARLNVREDDYLTLLEACGRECIGDVLVEGGDSSRFEAGKKRLSGSYEPIDASAMADLLENDERISESNIASRLSLAGTQGKTGLAHMPGSDMIRGWLLPVGHAATTHMLKTSHMRDIPENEFVCMKAAQACGLDVAAVALIDCGRSVLCVERFDRQANATAAGLDVARTHQEDFAQAFGVLPASKYAEVEGGSIRAIARFLKRRSLRPARDLAAFTKMLCFSYLIGNCDAHLKNYSIRFVFEEGRGGGIVLAPAYDFVCTTMFPRFSRNMAMSFGGVHDIDAVDAQSLDALAGDLGISKSAFKRLAAPIADGLAVALRLAGSGSLGSVFSSTAYIADEIEEDAYSRIELLKSYCAK